MFVYRENRIYSNKICLSSLEAIRYQVDLVEKSHTFIFHNTYKDKYSIVDELLGCSVTFDDISPYDVICKSDNVLAGLTIGNVYVEAPKEFVGIIGDIAHLHRKANFEINDRYILKEIADE